MASGSAATGSHAFCCINSPTAAPTSCLLRTESAALEPAPVQGADDMTDDGEAESASAGSYPAPSHSSFIFIFIDRP